MNDSSSNVDKTRIALIALAVVLALGIGAVIYFLTANNNRPQNQTSSRDYLKTVANEATTYKSPSQTNSSINLFDDFKTEVIDNKIQVKSHIMDDEGVILIIKNIAGVTLDIKAKLNLYDKHKNLIVDFDETAMAVAKDYEFLMFFPYASEFDAVDYSFTIDNSNFDPIELSFEEITKDNGEVFLRVNNDGKQWVHEPHVFALYFKNGYFYHLMDIEIDNLPVLERWDAKVLEDGVSVEVKIPPISADEETTIKYYVYGFPFIVGA